MDLGEKGKKFVCPNYPSHYFPGKLILPKDFCLEVSANVPEKILLHVPPGLVWSAIYSKEMNCIQGLHNFMIYYSVKPYYLIALEYMGGPDFNMQIYNPYGVEINYIVRSPCKSCYADGKFFNFSDIEVDRLGGIMSCNVYSTGLVVYDLFITKKHLTNKEYTKVLKRSAFKTLGIRQSMEFVDLSFKDFSWTVKLKWENGKAYMDRKWYDFAKAGNSNEGDICAFHLTREPGKYRICIYETVLLSRCNEKGICYLTYSGIEYHHNSEELDALIEEEAQETIMLSDSSDASKIQDNNSFLVTLKKSHVDKKVHGVYIPRSLYPMYNTWKQSTTVTLICGEKSCGVTVLRKGKMCRFGCGWTQFTTMNELREGQTLELEYVVMAFHDNEVPRIFKVALKDTCLSGVMTLPKKFSEYTGRIPASVQIILKDGFEWDVKFWKERNSLHGLKALLEYYDECDLLGKYIMKIVVYQGDDFDELFLSDRVLEKFEKALPNIVRLRIKNGKEYVAKYRRNENKLTGFKQLQDEIEIKFGDVVILSCCGDAMYTVSVFGPDGMEKIPRSADIVKGYNILNAKFSFTLQRHVHIILNVKTFNVNASYPDLGEHLNL
ncbi:hypothetical protein ACET3Z_018301 [Daucus carota]